MPSTKYKMVENFTKNIIYERLLKTPRKSYVSRKSYACTSKSYLFPSYCLLVAVLAMCCHTVLAFNLDTDSIVTHSGPTGSQFGFSVTQHRDRDGVWVVIGAPKNNDSSSIIIRPGSVFRCSTVTPGSCDVLPSDSQDNTWASGVALDDKKDQWFGATVVSRAGVILACAPRYVWFGIHRLRREPVGRCLIFPNGGALRYQLYAPCMTNAWGYHRQGSCQAGFSAALTKNGHKLFVGAVGSWYWQGQVFKQNLLNRQDLSQTAEGPQFSDNSYLGYSSASGRLGGDAYPFGDLFSYNGSLDDSAGEDVVVGSPRAKGLVGQVHIYNQKLTLLAKITGEQLGGYFGYSVAVGDVNGDGLDDVIAGAPFYTGSEDRTKGKRKEEASDRELYENGMVGTYLQSQQHNFVTSTRVFGQYSRGHFGLSVAFLSDINADGYGDVAVGAPQTPNPTGSTSTGAVYIFLGGAEGLQNKPSQVLMSSQFTTVPVRSFGWSLSGGLDTDENEYPDLVVGAQESDKAFVLLARPVVIVTPNISFGASPTTEAVGLDLTRRRCNLADKTAVACLPVRYCLQYGGRNVPHEIELQVLLKLDSGSKTGPPRLQFLLHEGTSSSSFTMNIRIGRETCNSTWVFVLPEAIDKLSPLTAELSYNLAQPQIRGSSSGEAVWNAENRFFGNNDRYPGNLQSPYTEPRRTAPINEAPNYSVNVETFDNPYPKYDDISGYTPADRWPGQDPRESRTNYGYSGYGNYIDEPPRGSYYPQNEKDSSRYGSGSNNFLGFDDRNGFDNRNYWENNRGNRNRRDFDDEILDFNNPIESIIDLNDTLYSDTQRSDSYEELLDYYEDSDSNNTEILDHIKEILLNHPRPAVELTSTKSKDLGDGESKFRSRRQAYRYHLPPILPPVTPEDKRSASASVRLMTECGEDRLCHPDLRTSLRLDATNTDTYISGSRAPIHVLLTVLNLGESAYLAKAFFSPGQNGTDFTRFHIVQSPKEVTPVCTSTNERDSDQLGWISCEIGNPFPAGGRMELNITFEPNPDLLVVSTLLFRVSVNSSNEEIGFKRGDNNATLEIPVTTLAELDIRGVSWPDDALVYNATQYGVKLVGKDTNIDREHEIGPVVSHVYEVTNQGPSILRRAQLVLMWPSRTLAEKPLLYLTKEPQVTPTIQCRAMEDFNYLNIKMNTQDDQPYSISSSDSVKKSLQKRSIDFNGNYKDLLSSNPTISRDRRDLPTMSDDVLSCGASNCSRFICLIENLEKKQHIVIRVYSRLWVDTVQELGVSEVTISSRLVVRTLKPLQGPNKTSDRNDWTYIEPWKGEDIAYRTWSGSVKSVVRASVEQVHSSVEWIIIIGSILAGLFVLAILILILWMLGFFKRRRAPQDVSETEPLRTNGFYSSRGDT